jgi:hypothetical protein
VATPLGLADILNGLERWKKLVPGIHIFHALAVWQVYRAHTESVLDEVTVLPMVILARWQGEVMRRIKTDLAIAMRKDNLGLFESTWTKVRCQWFVFDTGEGVNRRNRLVFDGDLLAPVPVQVQNE